MFSCIRTRKSSVSGHFSRSTLLAKSPKFCLQVSPKLPLRRRSYRSAFSLYFFNPSSKKYVFEKLYLWSQAVLAFNRKVGKTIRISKFCNRKKKVLKLIELNVRKSVRSPKELFTLLNIIFFPIVYTLLLNYWYCFYLFTMSF